MEKNKNASDLNIQNISWNLKPLFSGDNELAVEKVRKETETATARFVKIWEKREDYLQNPIILAEALKDYEKWQRNFGGHSREVYYFSLRLAQDQTNPKVVAYYLQAVARAKKTQNEMRFFGLKVAKIPKENHKTFLENNALKNYCHYLKRLFAESDYLLSEKEEKILSLTATPAHESWVRMTETALSKESKKILTESGKREVSFNEILSLTQSAKKSVRLGASLAINEITAKHGDTAEAELNAILLNKKIDDDLRGFKRPDAARHLNDDVNSEVVDNLISSVARRFDISARFYKFKAKLLGVKRLAYYERGVPFGKAREFYSYREALKLVHKVFSNLDPEFGEILKKFSENGNIDVFPKTGRAGGAFCAHNLITLPTYILLNHTNRLRDVLTLAHEAGHGINNELMREKQSALYFETSLATAEVASTFMEDFVLEDLRSKVSDENRLSLMTAKLNDDISTVFRQAAGYKFETELHNTFRLRGYLSKMEIGELFKKHMANYLGSAVEMTRGSENWWVYWSHFRNFFYVYSYASGLLISKFLQAFVRADENNIVKVKEFLSAGASDSPARIFKNIGIDIARKNFWDESLDEVEKLLEDTINLARKIGKIT